MISSILESSHLNFQKLYSPFSAVFYSRMNGKSKQNEPRGKWHHIFCALETSRELDRLIKSANNEKENPLLALKKGGAYRTASNFFYLEINHPYFFKEYTKMLDNSDKLNYIENKIKTKCSSRFAGNIVKEMDTLMYISTKLVKYV